MNSAEHVLEDDPFHDATTGLAVQQVFEDRVRQAETRCRVDLLWPPSVLLVALDPYDPRPRDSMACMASALRLTISRRLGRLLDGSDTLSHFGDDRFAFLIVRPIEHQAISTLAERCRQSVRTPIRMAEFDHLLTACVGAAKYDPENDEPLDVIKRAEEALRVAQTRGKGRISIDDRNFEVRRSLYEQYR